MHEPPFQQVTIIIPNFNGARLLSKNLPSVLAAMVNYPGRSELIVVDDASNDQSAELIEQHFPRVRLLVHQQNKGFSEAIHSGVKAAKSGALIFLNSDVRPDPDFIAPLIRHLDQPDVFSVTPHVVDGEGQPTEEAWRCYEIRSRRLRLLKLAGRIPHHAVGTLFTSGGSMALSKDKFDALGGFAPIFKPFYSEDSDLGVRAWRRGWQNIFEPASRVVHDHVGSSINTNVASGRVRLIRRRNQFVFEWIHVPARDLFGSLLPGYGLQAFGRLFRLDYVYFGGLLAALWKLPDILRSRVDIQKNQVMGFWDAMRRIRCSVETSGWKNGAEQEGI